MPMHACSADRLGMPSDNADACRIRASRGYLSDGTSAAMVPATGLRNVLVHEYVDVDDAIVLARLQAFGDLHDFIQQAGGWLSGKGGTGDAGLAP